jgi:ribonuclease HII
MSRYDDLKRFDLELQREYRGAIIGVDEVGVGSLCGPVTACALILKNYDGLDGVDDSKQLTPTQRFQVYERILPKVREFSLGWVSAYEVDVMGIRKASQESRLRAFLNLRSTAGVVIVDGEEGLPTDDLPCQTIIKADSKSLTVAAASILAKVTRDRFMVDLAGAYPQYGWVNNKGYGTDAHMRAIQEFGVTPYHRHAFTPVGKARKEESGDVSLRSLRRREEHAT